MNRYFLLAFLLFVTSAAVKAQPKFEFRATWVATVVNIDWPSKPGLMSDAQKREVIDILEMAEVVRDERNYLAGSPHCRCVFNPSHLEPWSRYLSGKQGTAPQPYYDPLEFWINECHKRGMELHAWLNPYRVAQNVTDPLATTPHCFSTSRMDIKVWEQALF